MLEQLPHPQNADTPIEIHGYQTDPLRRGYQILTNYENMYWRALVGNDAWGLYEVLRSFCHDQTRTCYPSVNLLMGILGLQDRRVLTGRIKTVRETEYRYPGLIETLQQHDLIIAEVKGAGATLRYLFHVNLTPGLLSSAQLQQLPPVLQTKHTALLQRCHEAKTELVERKRPTKVQGDHPDQQKERCGKFPEEDLGISHTPSGNFPAKQYLQNTTQKTTTAEHPPAKSSTTVADDVVVALTKIGLGKSVATALADRHPPAYIDTKLDYLAFLNQSPGRGVTNPRGWLRKAIEEDYGPPDGYKPHAQRQAETDAKKQQQTAIDAAIAEQERAWAPQTWRTWIIQACSTAEELQPQTNQLLAFYRTRLNPAVFLTWVTNLLITDLRDEDARVAVPTQQAQAWLIYHLMPTLEEAFLTLWQRRIAVTVEVMERPQREKAAG